MNGTEFINTVGRLLSEARQLDALPPDRVHEPGCGFLAPSWWSCTCPEGARLRDDMVLILRKIMLADDERVAASLKLGVPT